ncbi:hypothetical protein PPSIR1_03183 [Plesiocystis pacifica SIR-1]|uniref:Uncharacterized protein n=1 Tax=Plesiocystis pacifica SIR-1 TaxID=391625 RepID=A6GJE2_9BACT|nr:hypothetical protein [Plesiocystis pacifica]EDM74005.1 hypothetical protein PPSIR1_03183 [Plesiocystis pacifica SIR-1]
MTRRDRTSKATQLRSSLTLAVAAGAVMAAPSLARAAAPEPATLAPAMAPEAPDSGADTESDVVLRPPAPELGFDLEPLRPPTPKDGVGSIVGGSVALGASATIVGTMAATNPQASAREWAVPASFATLGAAVGTTALVIGARRHRRYRAHAAEHGPGLSQGHGLLVGGSTALVLGAIGGTAAAYVMAFEGSWGGEVSPLGPGAVMAYVSAGSAVTGAALIGLGASKNRRWRASEEAFQVQPTFSATPQGGSVGIQGRF